jgi:hypothetical protein
MARNEPRALCRLSYGSLMLSLIPPAEEAGGMGMKELKEVIAQKYMKNIVEFLPDPSIHIHFS